MNERTSLKFIFRRAQLDPHLILPGVFALLNGYWHKLKFRFLFKKVRIGKWFRVYGTFRIMGCGSVVIGDNCFIQSKLFKPVAFMTTLPEGRIEIGNNVGFSGTTIQCFKQVMINDWCNIADAYIIDSAAHHLSADRRSLHKREVPSELIKLEENVWISTKVVICKGVSIGENSVVGACSLVRKNIPANSFYAGNPAQLKKPIPAIHSSNIDELK